VIVPDKEEKPKTNMNIKAAQIHLLGDGIQAVGVIVAAIIIYFRPEWKIADPITTFVFAIIVLGTTVPVSIECVKILMEYSPSNLDAKELYEKI
jgi:zinc transporter 2